MPRPPSMGPDVRLQMVRDLRAENTRLCLGSTSYTTYGGQHSMVVVDVEVQLVTQGALLPYEVAMLLVAGAD